MLLRLLVAAITISVMPLLVSAQEGAPRDARPLHAAFGEHPMPTRDPFPAEALSPTAKPGCPGLLNQRLTDLRGRSIDLCGFKGQVLLIVNTASECGYTPQYKGLQALQTRFAAQGLAVLGFPSNDFGQQEPGSNAEIGAFCEANYGVTFPLFGKVTVLGPQKIPLFKALTTTASGTVTPGEIQWNFEKFLIGRDGTLLGRFPSSVEPESATLLQPLQVALGG
jgi:glutathione peroxidase